MNENLTLFIHLLSGIALVFMFVWSVTSHSNYKKEVEKNKAREDELSNASLEIDKISNAVRQAERKIAELLDKNVSLEKQLQTSMLEKAGLESANKLLKLENAKLLKAASDDITINVKAMDDAKIIAENPKPKRRYNKKKRNQKQ